MKLVLQEILDWSEVWAPLIPLTILLIKPGSVNWIKPLRLYLLFAFFIDLTGNLIWKRMDLHLESWMQEHIHFLYNRDGSFSNTLLYNIHSLLRFLLFAWFFHYQGNIFRKINWLIPTAFLAMSGFVFFFFKDIRDFSSLLLATEAAILLLYCLLYYLTMLRDEHSSIKRSPAFWAVTGLSIYVVINFPIFLFYTVLAQQAEKFAVNIWDIHNISYLVLCLFIAKSFYAANQQY